MTIYEVLTVVLIVVMAAASTAGIYLGLLGMVDQLYIVRCAGCNHVTFSSTKQPPQSCWYCRHPVLAHPVLRARVTPCAGVAPLQDALR